MAHVNVALVGYAFMGRAHSNAWRQVARFFTPPLTPRMKVICGRSAKNVRAAAEQLGWEEAATDWHDVVTRADIDIVDSLTGFSGSVHTRKFDRNPEPYFITFWLDLEVRDARFKREDGSEARIEFLRLDSLYSGWFPG